MAEVEAIQDIPTVEKMREAIDTVGEAEFRRRVEAQYKKYGTERAFLMPRPAWAGFGSVAATTTRRMRAD
jgi:hypothetical protein